MKEEKKSLPDYSNIGEEKITSNLFSVFYCRACLRKSETYLLLFAQGVCACMHPSGFVWAITPKFMDGFQNYLSQLLSALRRRSAI